MYVRYATWKREGIIVYFTFCCLWILFIITCKIVHQDPPWCAFECLPAEMNGCVTGEVLRRCEMSDPPAKAC